MPLAFWQAILGIRNPWAISLVAFFQVFGQVSRGKSPWIPDRGLDPRDLDLVRDDADGEERWLAADLATPSASPRRGG